MGFFSRNIRPAIIVLGFLSSVAGTLGSFLLLERLSNQVKALADQRNGAAREIEKLGVMANSYFVANQQGDLIYVLGLQDTSRKDLVGLIYKGNLLDRAEPIRNVIGALAIAGRIDFRKVYGEYERLNDIARASQQYGPYVAVKNFERDVVTLAQQRVAELQSSLEPLQQEMTTLEAKLRKRQLVILSFSVVGACLLLLANLLEHKVKKAAEVD